MAPKFARFEPGRLQHVGVLQEVYKIRITDLNKLKQRLITEWAKLEPNRHCNSRLSMTSLIAPDQ